ncbi:MAG: hypothetical protein A3G41_06045 [Elusimicrobia bacterium RIFCSPLOWO2_12_FULL_59_9]|nr:MAG: hypothetical protein A3G41_06045 [Elusimicrobia bacterium RIFCSPLOWO2_12_FULL_59_9]
MRTDSRDREQKLFEVADGQGGYFTAQQARPIGYYNRLQHYHKEKGDWLHIERGIYRLRNYPNSEREDLIRWSLWSFNRKGEPQITFSHQTALAFHELGDFMPAKLHVTVPPAFRKMIPGGCVVHRAVLLPEDVKSISCFKVTTPLRSLFDSYAADAEPDQLERAIVDALTRGMVRLDQIQQPGPSNQMEKFLAYVREIRNRSAHKSNAHA